MAKQIVSYSVCKCGAITLYFADGTTNSCKRKTSRSSVLVSRALRKRKSNLGAVTIVPTIMVLTSALVEVARSMRSVVALRWRSLGCSTMVSVKSLKTLHDD